MFFEDPFYNKHSSNMSTGETQLSLNQDNCTFEKLIKCNDLLNQYRNWNPKLISFFSKEENIKSIFNFLINARNRKDFSSVSDLFKTSNTFLNRIFTDSIHLCDYAMKNINNCDNSCNQYISGTILLLLNLSYREWPKEVHQILHYSNIAYNILIENIDQDCVFVFINNLIIDSYPISEFVWYLFRSVSKTNTTPPRICFLAENREVPDISNLRIHKLRAISIFKKYFELDLPMNEDFQEIVMNYISDEVSKNDDYPEFLDLALAIGPNDRFEQIIYQKLSDAWNKFQDNNPTISPFILSLSMIAFKQYKLPFSESIRDELPKPFLLTLQNWENKEFIESAQNTPNQ